MARENKRKRGKIREKAKKESKIRQLTRQLLGERSMNEKNAERKKECETLRNQ